MMLKIGEDVTVNVELPVDATGDVVAIVNDKNYTAKAVDGSANITISGLSTGNYNIAITYNGDGAIH